VLIACDNQDQKTFPRPETARAPEGWLPALAFANKTLLGEVTVYRLQNTERIHLKYTKENQNFKIATWIRKFLTANPDGLGAVKYLNFRHMHSSNSFCSASARRNASFELVALCRNLLKLDITSHASKLVKPGPVNIGFSSTLYGHRSRQQLPVPPALEVRIAAASASMHICCSHSWRPIVRFGRARRTAKWIIK
jgi:hypothetical protein